MTEGFWRRRQPPLFLLFVSVSSRLISGVAADPSTSQDGIKSVARSNSSSGTGIIALYISVGVVAVALLAVFLWKLWKKKKREEEYARLLKLFEQDDELELELGLRD